MGKCVLVIGVRKACYRAAIELGHKVILWSDGPLHSKRKKNLLGWIETPYSDCRTGLTQDVINELSKYKVHRVIANTEETVVLGAIVRKHLKLKHLAVDVTERFHNKFIMKNYARKLSIPITDYELIKDNSAPMEIIKRLKFPLVIKPIDESGAQDVKLVRDEEDFKKLAKPGLLAEAYVKGTEVSVETLVQNGKPIFHNMTEYLHQWRKSVVPARIHKDLYREIININDQVINGFGVDRGMTHAEFYLTDNGPLFGEIAIRPPGGYYMDLIQRVYNFDSWKAYVSLSCGDKNFEINKQPNGCAAVFMIHPGSGVIKNIRGLEKVKEKVSGIFDLSIRKEIGESVLEHENTSNEVGHILFWAETREDLDKNMKFIEENLTFDMES